MRTLEYNGQKLDVFEHIILRNGWEYYVLDNKDSDIRTALVMGFEAEIGDFSVEEIKPYIISRTTNLSAILPVLGGKWAN